MILVCGDAMTDRYVWGDVTRLSPDAPVPVVKVTREEDREGATLNVANNIRAMGVRCEVLHSDSQRIVKLRLMGRNHHVARVDYDFPQSAIDQGLYRKRLEESRLVVFCDYGKGSLSEVEKLITMAISNGVPVMVDPKGHDFKRYRGADLIKPNADEMRDWVGGWSSEKELCDKARRLMKDSGIQNILLTRGAEGMVLISPDGEFYHESLAEEVVCVSGAGESAISAMAVAVHEGHSLRKGMIHASRAAAAAVSRFGTTVVTRAEVFGARRTRKDSLRAA